MRQPADRVLPDAFVLRGAKVIDGSGGAAQAADLMIRDGLIFPAAPGTTVGLHTVDLDGLVVSPGFIDTHSHADLASLLYGDLSQIQWSRLLQGVTTEVVGNCGFSPFPVSEESREMSQRFLSVVFGPATSTFTDITSYRDAVERSGPASNIAPLVGHGTLRADALGNDKRPATPAELHQMKSNLRLAMSEGAFGLSSGLCYSPATFAEPEELRSLTSVLALTGGIYATHVRNETDLVLESIDEALGAVEETGVRVHISHLKVAGRANWGRSAEILDMLDAARAAGVDVTADVYPYTAASTMLHSLLPPWMAEGGLARLLMRLDDTSVLDRAAADLIDGIPGWQNLGQAAGWDHVVIASASGHDDWEGRSVADLAQAAARTVIQMVAGILLACEGRVVVVIEAMDGMDVSNLLRWPHSVIGSDGIPLPGTPHPRLTGTFPRVLDAYRADLGGLEQAIHRMTAASAKRFEIPRRGAISSGLIADLVVLDPDVVSDRSTYEEPWLSPSGISHVFLAGEPAVWHGEVVNDRAGSVLRRDTGGVD